MVAILVAVVVALSSRWVASALEALGPQVVCRRGRLAA